MRKVGIGRDTLPYPAWLFVVLRVHLYLVDMWFLLVHLLVVLINSLQCFLIRYQDTICPIWDNTLFSVKSVN